MKRELLECTPYEGLMDGTHIEVEVYYNKGGINHFSGASATRGYYLSVVPVSRKGDGIVSYTLFSGISKLLLSANRFSEKQLAAAVEMGRNEAPALVAYVLERERAKKEKGA